MWHIFCSIKNKKRSFFMKDIYKPGLILISAFGAFLIGLNLPKAITKLRGFLDSCNMNSVKKNLDPSKINFC